MDFVVSFGSTVVLYALVSLHEILPSVCMPSAQQRQAKTPYATARKHMLLRRAETVSRRRIWSSKKRLVAEPTDCQCQVPQSGESLRWYMYDLPPQFNEDLINNYTLLVPHRAENAGIGRSFEVDHKYKIRAHMTYQFHLDIIAHRRLSAKGTPTAGRTDNPCQAHVFYVPYLAHLNYSRFRPQDFELNLTGSAKDTWPKPLATEFDSLMFGSDVFQKFQSCPHVMFFPRVPRQLFHKMSGVASSSWFQAVATAKQINILTIEPWAPGKLRPSRPSGPAERGLTWKLQKLAPYPSFFHPCTELDIHQHRLWVNASVNRTRIVYVGSQMTELRSRIVKWCQKHHNQEKTSSCLHRQLDHSTCGEDAYISPDYFKAIVGVLYDGDFCLHPRGDTVTRKSIWDGAAVGCLPVVFEDQYGDIDFRQELRRWELDDIFIFIRDDGNLEKHLDNLRKTSEGEILQRRERLMEKLPRLVYRSASCVAEPSGAGLVSPVIEDSLDFALRRLMW